ncbi:MAG: hypothetical protein A49_30390 [Methyloceanibacter sp.]|nr:MAG: hypothetical protein A49_30390 [Methyloceanibacter sp.]
MARSFRSLAPASAADPDKTMAAIAIAAWRPLKLFIVIYLGRFPLGHPHPSLPGAGPILQSGMPMKRPSVKQNERRRLDAYAFRHSFAGE